MVRSKHYVAQETTASLELSNRFAGQRLLDLEHPYERYASNSTGSINQLVGVSLFYSSHLSIAGIIPSLTDDGIFDFLNSFPTLGLLQYDYLVLFVEVTDSFFAGTRKSPTSVAKIDGSGSGLICKLDLYLAELRSLIDVQHLSCDKARSFGLLTI